MKTNRYVSKGNALVETIVLMVVMIPIMFALAMVGDLIDLKQNLEQASRYTSWESTVASQPHASTSSQKVRERFFSASDMPIRTDTQQESSNALWGQVDDPQGDFQSESVVTLDQSSINVVFDENVTVPSVAMKIGRSAAHAGEILDGVSGNAWGLSKSGPSSATVEAKIEASNWLPTSVSSCSDSGSDVCLSSNAVILGDSWSAAGDAHAVQRVRSLMPASLLEPVGDAVSVVGHLPLLKELKDLKGAFGHVNMDVLPEYTGR